MEEPTRQVEGKIKFGRGIQALRFLDNKRQHGILQIARKSQRKILKTNITKMNELSDMLINLDYNIFALRRAGRTIDEDMIPEAVKEAVENVERLKTTLTNFEDKELED